MLSMRCRPPGGAMPRCATYCRGDDRQYPLLQCPPCAAARPPPARCHDVRPAVVVTTGSIHCLMLSARCHPPGGAMPRCATRCRCDVRQYPLPRCPPCAAARPVARCLDARPTVVAMHRRQHSLPRCSPCAAARPAARCHDARPAVVVMMGSTR